MQENHLFEYAVIRVVPKVEREEFVNVGVILLCSKLKFLQAQIQLNEARLSALCADIDRAELQEHIHSFERICVGGADGGPIGQLPLAERFRWLIRGADHADIEFFQQPVGGEIGFGEFGIRAVPDLIGGVRAEHEVDVEIPAEFEMCPVVDRVA